MDHAELLRTLARHGVEFIVVGGTAAVLNGAPVHTFDLDIVYSRSSENVTRLMAALRELDALFRSDPRRIAPVESHLRSAGHKLLQTKHGPLDVLGTVEENTTYEELLPDCIWLEVSEVPVRVLGLERLIAIKEKLSRPKDQVMLLMLRATLEEARKRGDR
jgi:predicted nucleotidyltransferase